MKMKILLLLTLTLIGAFILSGCVTTYEYSSVNTDGSTKNLKVRSWRQYEDFYAEYGEFKVRAGGVKSGSEVEAMRDVVLSLIPLIQPTPGE